MLSREEKREMLEDGRNPKRAEDFYAAEEMAPLPAMTFDEFVKWLDDIQKVFGPFPVSVEPTITDKNLL